MRIIILIVLVISGLTAVACSSEAPSTADTQTASRPTADVPATVEAGIRSTREAETAVDATVEAKVAAALTTSTSATGPTNTPAATTLPLDEYLTLCASTEQELADDATYGDLSSELAAERDRFEALTPPAQLSEWHLLNIEAYRTAQAVLDTQPMDDVIDFDSPTMNAAGDDFEEKLREGAARVPEDVLQRMIGAGCIDSSLVPDDYADLPDDHGNSEGDATAIRVGADVRGTLDYDDDIDFFRFQAERGQSYQIDVALGTLDDSIVELYDVDWSFLDSSDDYGETYASRLYWEAPSSGERYVAVYGYGTGTYTLTVSHSTIVDDHGDTAEDGPGVASDRAALVALYNAMEGGSWTTRTNWLSGRPLDEWYGVTTNNGGRVTGLNLSSNSVYGALPAELGDLTKLRELRLADNPLRGPIPAELGDLSNLRVLNLGSQGRGSLNGPIPAALGNLTNLESLDLSSNELTGPIPAWLGDLTNLRALNLWSNELTGPIPAWLGDLANLEYLSLGWNELTGPIPAKLGDLTNLEWLLLTNSELTGTIPAALGDLTNLKGLHLSFNKLTGPIPTELSNLANLEFLDLGTNRLTGPIPAELSNLANLSELQLLGNQLTGCVPVGLRDVAEENDLGELGLPDCGLEGRPTASSFVYDSDGDGLIEVANLEQLDAIRWDLDGDGSPVSNATGYYAAFPNAVAGMGCPDSECSGYELISDLDFDTNGNGRADAGDAYWNDGEGWVPIGDDTNNSAFRTFFNGGGHTISNLYIDRRDARYIGLFGITWFDGINWVGLNNNIRDLALVNVDVQGGLYTGGLAGANGIVIVACSVTGVVNGNIQVGGLVGGNSNGTVIASYSTASVGYAGGGFGERVFGGLVGDNHGGTITASYSIGSVTSDFGEVGGLVGLSSNFAGRGTASDSYWDTQTSGQSESARGEGRTTSELQSPAGHTGIYENWNVDLDEDGVGDDLWDFGNASQYPTLSTSP